MGKIKILYCITLVLSAVFIHVYLEIKKISPKVRNEMYIIPPLSSMLVIHHVKTSKILRHPQGTTQLSTRFNNPYEN